MVAATGPSDLHQPPMVCLTTKKICDHNVLGACKEGTQGGNEGNGSVGINGKSCCSHAAMFEEATGPKQPQQRQQQQKLHRRDEGRHALVVLLECRARVNFYYPNLLSLVVMVSKF